MDLDRCRGDAGCLTTGFTGDEKSRFNQLCADGAAFYFLRGLMELSMVSLKLPTLRSRCLKE